MSQTDLILAWDRWSGWAHVATHQRGSSERPRFTGIVHLAAADTHAVRDRLGQAGFEVRSEYRVDDQLVELRLGVPAGVSAVPPANPRK
ncbi:hypothetical protein [Amycolatopsis thermoflava]|uniref:hypothetical protein n=1 Tax=Amycolatopsis thermoflava TaxID=84480 RepID=UPI00382F5012